MSKVKGRILIVDDHLENLEVLYAILSKSGYEIRRAINGTTALIGVKTINPDIILLDINMPEMNGYDVCKRIKEDENHKDIPIIFISALDDGLDKAKAFSSGGVDFITKPFEIIELLSRIENQLQIKAVREKLLQLNAELEERVLEKTQEFQSIQQGMEQVILESQKVQTELQHMAWHDPLTNLPNRTWLKHHLEKLLQDSNQKFALLFIDCDCFKVVNDSFGHILGDQFLKEIAIRLHNCLCENSNITRFGGDEFIVVLENIEHPKEAELLANKLQEAMLCPLEIGDNKISMTISIGIAIRDGGVKIHDELIHEADIAMYQAKKMKQK